VAATHKNTTEPSPAKPLLSDFVDEDTLWWCGLKAWAAERSPIGMISREGIRSI
jgi:hypothetical protein